MNKILKILVFVSLTLFNQSTIAISLEKNIKIGLLIPLSGDNKEIGQQIIKSTRVALKDINSKKEVLDNQIDEEIKKAEQEIVSLKKGAPEKINKIAIETSSELVKKLIGAEINNSSISAIVDDLSKKNGDKYYGS